MKYIYILVIVVSAVSMASAQTNIQVGPRVGLNMGNARYTDRFGKFDTQFQASAEAGVMASATRGHLSLQVSALYAQKAFQVENERTLDPRMQTTWLYREETQLNYLTLPVSVAYTQQQNGQGFQVFAGGYLGVLLNGRMKTFSQEQEQEQVTYSKKADDEVTPRNNVDIDYSKPYVWAAYAKRLDAGLQAGLGYRYRALLLQLGYSYGVINRQSNYQVVDSGIEGVTVVLKPAKYYHRVAQLSATYLFGKTN